MTGYGGVEGVIYRAWLSILEQTESGELVIVWSPPEGSEGRERSLNPVQGWDVAVQEVEKEIEGVKKREEENPKGRKQNGESWLLSSVAIEEYIWKLPRMGRDGLGRRLGRRHRSCLGSAQSDRLREQEQTGE